MDSFAQTLKGKLSSPSTLLLESDSEFKEALKRWSDRGVETPVAIVQPATEIDIVVSVKEAVAARTPVVPACGGHSNWSTVKDGLVIDLSKYKHVAVNSDETATIKGGVLMKDLQVALSKEGKFTTVGNGGTVGAIPYFINGGISTYTPLIGYACENIVSARVVTAKGEVVEASATKNPELLWAIRGAGQFFGLVIDLTVRTYPLSSISPDGTRQVGTYIFTTDKAKQVCEAMTAIVNDTKRIHAGHFMAVNAPPEFKNQVLLVAPQLFGKTEDLAELCQPLVDLGPVQQMQVSSDFEHHSDHLDYMCGKGDFKKFSQIGVKKWDADMFLKVIELQAQLIRECPGSEKSGYSFEWHTPTKPEARAVETSFGMADSQHWVNIFSWYHDPAQHQKVDDFDSSVRKVVREGTHEQDFVAYTNTHREEPLENRYKGLGRVARLKALKQLWDPTGVFTEELL